LIDCPGIVYNSTDTQTDVVLKGVVRAEKIQDPEVHIQAILDRADRQSLVSIYGIEKWEDSLDYLEQLALKMGKLIKGGDPNIDSISRLMIRDWQRGKIPYLVVPSREQEEAAERVEKVSYNPALLIELHKKGDEDLLDIEPEEMVD